MINFGCKFCQFHTEKKIELSAIDDGAYEEYNPLFGFKVILMTKATPLPLYDEFMLVFRNHKIENWEAKDFVKVITRDSQNINKKIQFQIYKALKILVRFNYLSIDKSKSTKKLYSYCETKRLQELRVNPIRQKLAQIFEEKELELLQQIHEKEKSIDFIKSIYTGDDVDIKNYLFDQVIKKENEINSLKSDIKTMHDMSIG